MANKVPLLEHWIQLKDSVLNDRLSNIRDENQQLIIKRKKMAEKNRWSKKSSKQLTEAGRKWDFDILGGRMRQKYFA